MLGIRLSPEAEDRLARYARDAGRPKSVLARDWIMEKLDEKEVDHLFCEAARIHAPSPAERERAMAMSAAHLRWIDAEDGGYDWGPDGPPATL